MQLQAARRLALALPGSTEVPHHALTSWRVGGRIFATADPAQPAWLRVFVPEAVREPALAMHPQALSPLRWGARVVGLQIDLAQADTALVHALLHAAWRVRAPAAARPRDNPG